MPLISIKHSPLAGGPSDINYRELTTGSKIPLVFLHGGWGYEIYPISRQLTALQDFPVLIPDRSGYGRSTKPAFFDTGFHRRAAEETLRYLDSLNIDQCIFWGHSDGAVIAAWIGLDAPERCQGLILESFHYDCQKTSSRAFFEAMAFAPDTLGNRVCEVLSREHGEDYWRDLMRCEGQAWLNISNAANPMQKDLYNGSLSALTPPALILYGALDPRIEAWEREAVRRELPRALFHVFETAGHSPHSERSSADECTRIIHDALNSSIISSKLNRLT